MAVIQNQKYVIGVLREECLVEKVIGTTKTEPIRMRLFVEISKSNEDSVNVVVSIYLQQLIMDG
jgi:hypothetical protein